MNGLPACMHVFAASVSDPIEVTGGHQIPGRGV